MIGMLVAEETPQITQILQKAVQEIKRIKQDSKDRAYTFRDSLKNEIIKIPERPYSYRENLTMKDTQVRDLIFKGYVVVFVIDEGEQTITIISIYKHNLPNLKYPQ